MGSHSDDGRREVFVSYNHADRAWAEWIAWKIEEAGYSVFIQAWDSRPGSNFVLFMHRAAEQSRHTVRGATVVPARRHLKRARELVTSTGYGRREREVAYLERRLA